MKYSKTLVSGFSLLLLNGCLDVEDNNNNAEVVEALNAQTSAIENQKQTVTFQGLVVSSLDQTPITNAVITVKLGSEMFAENISVSEGLFSVSKLPANSDIEVIVTSDDNQFLARTFFVNTGSTSNGEAIKDFGLFSVSEPQEVQISVLNTVDNMPVESLEFIGYSHSGNSSTSQQYKHTSTFDAVTGVYTIILPKHINTQIMAKLDLDEDGVDDFTPEYLGNYYGSGLTIDSANTLETATIYVEESTETAITEVEYRVSILDDTASSIVEAIAYMENGNLQLQSSYDAATEQHVVVTSFDGYTQLNIPAFNVGDINYQSSYITISDQQDGTLYIRNSGYNGNNCCYLVANSDLVELAITPRITTTSNSTILEVVTASQKVDPITTGFSAFYSQAIVVPDGSPTLTFFDGFTVLKGNDSSDDLILPGITSLVGNIEIPTTHTLSLNDTKLTVQPTSTLVTPGTYIYTVDELVVKESEEITNVNYDSLTFTIESSEAFDINDVKIDNRNYTTNGSPIIQTNTAGEATSISNYNSSVYFYFPTSVTNLKNFTLRKVLVVNDGVTRTDIDSYTIIDNGSLQYYSGKIATVQLAYNEVVVQENMNISIHTGTAQSDSQHLYYRSTGEYMSDNISTSVNNITFEYAYETADGEISTGTITLDVQ